MQIDYTPSPTGRRLHQSPALIRAIMGPYGSGKSTACVLELLRWAMSQEPGPDGVRRTCFALIRNTYRQLTDTTLKTVFHWVPPGQAGTWISSRNTYKIRFGDVETEWLFRALDGPDDVRNLLSLELTGAWVNECREINPDVLVNLIGRTGRYPPPSHGARATRRGIIMDTNPPQVDSYYYRLFEQENDTMEKIEMVADAIGWPQGTPLVESFKQPSGLSPEAENLENLPEGYYETMLLGNPSEEWMKVHVHGQYGFLMDGKPVFPEFNGAFHVSPSPLLPVKGKVLSIGMDFGLTPAAVVHQQAASGRWLVLGELVSDNCGIEGFIERLLPWLRSRFPDHRDYEVWADPAGQQRSQVDEKTCFQALRAAGFIVRPGPQDLETRLGSVRRALSRQIDGGPGILYDPSCRQLIKGMHGLYRYKEIRGSDGRVHETPEKNEASHPMDAHQYAIGAYEGPAVQGRTPRQWGRHRPALDKPIKVTKSWKPW